jgi:hypothetical protein
MYRTLLGLSLVLLVAGLIAGCGGGGSEKQGTEPFWPLAVDNQWHYNYTEFTGGTALAAVARPHRGSHRALPRPAGIGPQDTTAEDVWTVTATAQIGGSTWYGMIAQYVGGDPSEIHYLQHGSEGLRARASLLLDPYFLIQLPLEEGNTWQDPLDPDITLTITSMTATTVVPAGTFNNCLVVEDRLVEAGQPDDVITSWYARDVGLVREENRVGAELVSELVLLSHNL